MFYACQLPIYIVLIFISTSSFAQQVATSLDHTIDHYYSNSKEPGIMLHITGKDKQIIYSNGVGLADLNSLTPINLNSNFRMASVSKQFTALAIRFLHSKNRLKFNQKIVDFFPQLTGENRLITILHLLNHTSGIVDYETLIPASQGTQLVDSNVLELITPVEQLYFSPGTKFRYSNTGYCLLSLIVSKVTGMKYEDFMKDILFQQMGMTNSSIYNKPDSINNRVYGYHQENLNFLFADQSITSATKGDGGVYTSAPDYLKASLAIIADLSSIMEDSVSSKDLFFPINEKIKYGQGLFIGLDNYKNRIYFHSGESTGFHNIVLMIPNRELCISLFSNRDDLKIAQFFDEVLKLMDIKVDGVENESLFLWLSKVYANQNL